MTHWSIGCFLDCYEYFCCTSESDFLKDFLCDLYYEDVRGPYVKPVDTYIPTHILEHMQFIPSFIVEPNTPVSINQIYKAYIDLYHYTHWMGSIVHIASLCSAKLSTYYAFW